MKDEFFKFPSTPHLATLGDVKIRGDKVMPESGRNSLLLHELVVEEKVDGANLGISFDAEGNMRLQNRGADLHLPASGQWQKLGEWLALRSDALYEHLTDRYILFGEWCHARHSVFYDRLPDWFLGFDLYDKHAGRFLSVSSRNEGLEKMRITQMPLIERGRFTLTSLERLLSQSRFGNQPAEGLYIRFSRGKWLEQRAKLVRPAFIQSVEQHWSRAVIKPNHLVQRPVEKQAWRTTGLHG